MRCLAGILRGFNPIPACAKRDASGRTAAIHRLQSHRHSAHAPCRPSFLMTIPPCGRVSMCFHAPPWSCFHVFPCSPMIMFLYVSMFPCGLVSICFRMHACSHPPSGGDFLGVLKPDNFKHNQHLLGSQLRLTLISVNSSSKFAKQDGRC